MDFERGQRVDNRAHNTTFRILTDSNPWYARPAVNPAAYRVHRSLRPLYLSVIRPFLKNCSLENASISWPRQHHLLLMALNAIPLAHVT